MKFVCTFPLSQPVLKLQLWDFDVLSSDDAIAETQLDFTELMHTAFEQDKRLKAGIHDQELVRLTNKEKKGAETF